jgi:hypothetical protein
MVAYILQMIFAKATAKGYVQALPRSTAEAQERALRAAGFERIVVEGKNETRADLIEMLRPGDVVGVTQMHVLAKKKTSNHDIPRDSLKAAIKEITEKRATIYETATGLHSKDPASRDEMIFAAFEHIASAGRSAAGKRNGGKSLGRPGRNWTEEQLKAMDEHWFSLKHRSNETAVRAINKLPIFKKNSVSVNDVWRAMTALHGKGKGGSGRGKT